MKVSFFTPCHFITSHCGTHLQWLTSQAFPFTLCQNELWTSHNVLCVIGFNGAIWLSTVQWHTQQWKKQGAVIQRWNKIDARRLWPVATSANVLWNYVSMETSYRHHRPLTSSFIIQTNKGPLWFSSLPRRPNVTQSGSLMIGDTHTWGR